MYAATAKKTSNDGRIASVFRRISLFLYIIYWF